jgi:hypothetical protein
MSKYLTSPDTLADGYPYRTFLQVRVEGENTSSEVLHAWPNLIQNN